MEASTETAIRREIQIAAHPDTVWQFLVQPEKATRWMGEMASLDARPGGEYRVQVLRLADGRIVQGVVKEQTPHTLTVETANETIRVPVGEIEARKDSPLSMMPEGLFDRLTAEELRDLVGYLASPGQVPLKGP